MEQLEEHNDVTIQWHAFELHPAGAPPISPERQARIMAGRPLLQQRAREQYGLEMNPGPFGTNSRPALVLEKYAQTQGKGAAFHVAAMRAYWEQGKDIGDTAVLRAVAEEVGLNTKDFEQILASEGFNIGCGACCIAPSISSPMPHGKPAGVRCPHLLHDHRCTLSGLPERPEVCKCLRTSEELCGQTAREAFMWLARMEQATQRGR